MRAQSWLKVAKATFLSSYIELNPTVSYEKIFKVFYIQSTLVISNFTGPDKNVRVISSSRQPNDDVIGMTTVRLSVRQNVLGRHMYMAI